MAIYISYKFYEIPSIGYQAMAEDGKLDGWTEGWSDGWTEPNQYPFDIGGG